MLKRLTITLLIISPIVIFAFEVFYPKSKIAPPEAWVGAWESEFETRFGKSQVILDLYKDGTVDGTVGDATMQDAYFKRNRGWLRRILGLATDYVIVGDLKGSVISEVQCAEFYIIIVDFDEKGIKADIDTEECWKDGKKHGRFGDGPLIYTRVEQPQK